MKAGRIDDAEFIESFQGRSSWGRGIGGVVGERRIVGIEVALDDHGSSLFTHDLVLALHPLALGGIGLDFLQGLHAVVDLVGVRLGGDLGVDVRVGRLPDVISHQGEIAEGGVPGRGKGAG